MASWLPRMKVDRVRWADGRVSTCINVIADQDRFGRVGWSRTENMIDWDALNDEHENNSSGHKGKRVQRGIRWHVSWCLTQSDDEKWKKRGCNDDCKQKVHRMTRRQDQSSLGMKSYLRSIPSYDISTVDDASHRNSRILKINRNIQRLSTSVLFRGQAR